MKKLLLLTLILSIHFSYAKTLKEIADGNHLILSSEPYKIDSFSQLIIHVPDFSQDYAFETYYFDKREKSELATLKTASNSFNSAWELANLEQQSELFFIQEQFDYSSDLSSHTQNDIFLIFKSQGNRYHTGGYRSIDLWSGGKEPQFITSIYIDGFELGDKTEILILMNAIQYELTGNLEYLNFCRENTDTEKMVDSYKKIKRTETHNFLIRVNNLTILFPAEMQSSKINKQLTQKWTHSKYKYSSPEEIADLVSLKDTTTYYMKFQYFSSAAKYRFNWLKVFFVNTRSQEILYTSSILLERDKEHFKHQDLLDKLLEEIFKYNTESSLVYEKKVFDFNYFPSDLGTSKLCYVNLNEDECKFVKAINRNFERNLKDHPNARILHYENKGSISQYKYQIKLSISVIYVGITTVRNVWPEDTKKNGGLVDHREPTRTTTNYYPREVFIIYLKNTKTGKTYSSNTEFERPVIALKNFFKEISK